MDDARRHLGRLAQDHGQFWNKWDRSAFERLTNQLKLVEKHLERLAEAGRRGEPRPGGML
jgi:hypothetical protein